MVAGHRQHDLAELAGVAPRHEPRAEAIGPHVARAIRGLRCDAERGEPLRQLWQDLHDARVVEAERAHPVERDAVAEVGERLLHVVEGDVVIEVLGIDVRHDRGGRRQREERAIALVSLGDEIVAFAPARVRETERIDATADHRRGIVPGGHQHRVHHRRRGGLAMRAGDRDRVLHPHQLAEHLGARDHRDLARARGFDLGVVALDRARHDDDIRLGEVIGAVPAGDGAADVREMARDLGIVHVGARHPVPHVDEHLGDAAHAHAADADEVDLGVLLAEHGTCWKNAFYQRSLPLGSISNHAGFGGLGDPARVVDPLQDDLVAKL